MILLLFSHTAAALARPTLLVTLSLLQLESPCQTSSRDICPMHSIIGAKNDGRIRTVKWSASKIHRWAHEKGSFMTCTSLLGLEHYSKQWTPCLDEAGSLWSTSSSRNLKQTMRTICGSIQSSILCNTLYTCLLNQCLSHLCTYIN
jgi:hypothetical protein